MKKLCVLFALFIIMGCIPAYAAEDVITQTFTCSFETAQGKNNFRFVQFTGDKIADMNYNVSTSRWEGVPAGVIKPNAITPGTTNDVGFLFTAPMKGVLKLQGTIGWALTTNDGGDGVLLTIGKGEEILWTQDVPFGETPNYELEVSARKGDKLWFKVNAKKHTGYDAIVWWPSVSYTTKAYSGSIGREGYQYMQRMDGVLSELTYDEEKDRFIASDGVAFMSDYEVMPSDKCSMVTRYVVSEDGKYRVSASVLGKDRRSGGSIVYVYHNNQVMWQQMIPSNEKGGIDVRFTAKKDDVVDIEVKTNDFSGYNYSEWSVDVERFDGAQPFSNATTTTVANYVVDSEFTLSSKIGSISNNSAEFYALYNDTKFPMTYSSGVWSANVIGDSTCKITSTAVTPGNQRGEPAIDLQMPQSGIIKIEGNLPVNQATNGMLIKIYLNDEEIWSNRVGGDVSVKYDEMIDTVYFVNDINVAKQVKAGDKLTFKFGKWRKWTNGTSLNIEDIKVKYIYGDMLSETTKWKIKQSTVIDVKTGKVYFNGKSESVTPVINNGTVYITESLAQKLGLGRLPNKAVLFDGESYVPVRDVAEESGKTVAWGAGRFVVIHEGISTFFGIPEFSEMLLAVKGGNLID